MDVWIAAYMAEKRFILQMRVFIVLRYDMDRLSNKPVRKINNGCSDE